MEASDTASQAGGGNGFDPNRWYVEEELFERGLSTLNDLRAAGELRVLVTGRGVVQFEIREERDRVRTALADHDMSVAELGRVIWDVTDALTAVANGYDRDVFLRARTDESRFHDEEVEDPEIAKRKFDRVTSEFDPGELRRRAWIKETSPVYVPRRLHWDVVSKHATSVGGPPGEAAVRFGALRLQLDTARGVPREEREFVVTVDREDVGFMMDSLRDLLMALEEDRGEA